MTVTEKKIVNMLRRYIQDTPVANVLTGKPENRDEDLLLFIRMALDDFNITPPLLTPYTTENFPSMNLLLSGAVVQMLLSNFILQTRNQLSYQDGGNLVQIFEKGPQYINGAMAFANSYNRLKEQFKTALNIQLGWGTVSPMADLNLAVFPFDDE